MNECEYWLGLKLIPELDGYLHRLLDFFGSPQKIWEAILKDFQSVVGGFFPLEKVQKIVTTRRRLDLEKEWQKLEKYQVKLLTVDSPDFPPLLKEIPVPPAVLFIKGRPLKDFPKALAIVGARKGTTIGKILAEELAFELSEAGLTIVSGLARGIDSAAHQGALKGKAKTVGVLGSGADIVYPLENKNLYQEIVAEGALVSEYPLGTPPYSSNFPPRNRIISGFSLGTVVVEAGEKSGALITADFALEQGREVFAVPGTPKNPLSGGPNKLLKEGAILVEKAEDILEAFNLNLNIPKKEKENLSLEPAERNLLRIIGWEPKHIDQIAELTQIPISSATAILTILEIKGLIKEDLGKKYVRI